MFQKKRKFVADAATTRWKLGKCAAAAGSAALAASGGTAEAEVRYTNVIPDLTTAYLIDTNQSTDVFFDMDGQAFSTGVHGDPQIVPTGADFRLSYSNNSIEKPLIDFPATGSNWAAGQMAKAGNNFDYAAIFGANEQIGPGYDPPPINVTTGAVWANSGWMENDNQGPWEGGGPAGANGVGAGFLGLRLDFDGAGVDLNYGWAQVRYNDEAGTMTLLDFAIESEVNTPITTPDITPPPVQLVGDFNGDLVVDGADLEKWKLDFGANGGSDADDDGDSDGDDFLLWQRNFTTPVGAVTTAAVPEPHALALAAMGAGGIAALRRRRRLSCDDQA